MKKKLLTAVSAVLLCSLALSATGCKSKDTADITPVYQGTSATAINEMFSSSATTSYNIRSVDSKGIAVVEKRLGSIEITTEYSLFDLKAGGFISNTTSETPISKLSDGLYYSSKLNVDSGKMEYNLYSKNQTYQKLEGSIDETNAVFTAKDNTRYYIDVNGNMATETDHFAYILTETSCKYNAEKFGDYYAINQGPRTILFDSNGKYLKVINWEYALSLKDGQDLQAYWMVGSNVFIQTRYELPADASKYDLFLSDDTEMGQKLDLETYRYDLVKDDLDVLKSFDYYVEEFVDGVNESAILGVCEIEDERLSTPFIQAFDEDGDVSVDIQKLAPNAIEFEWWNGYVRFMTSEGHYYLYQGEELIDEYEFYESRSYLNNVGFVKKGSVLYIYDLAGNQIANYLDVTDFNITADQNLYIICDKTIYVYDTIEKSQVTTTTLEDTAYNFSINEFFLQATNGNEEHAGYGKTSIQYVVGNCEPVSDLAGVSLVASAYGKGCRFAVVAMREKTSTDEYVTTYYSICCSYPYAD